jgi:hypothetical protein
VKHHRRLENVLTPTSETDALARDFYIQNEINHLAAEFDDEGRVNVSRLFFLVLTSLKEPKMLRDLNRGVEALAHAAENGELSALLDLFHAWRDQAPADIKLSGQGEKWQKFYNWASESALSESSDSDYDDLGSLSSESHILEN